LTRSSNAVAAVRSATAAMGTRFEIVVASTDGYSTHPIVEEALREIEDLHRRLTRFSADSLISHINRTAPFRPVRLDAGTFALLAAAQAVCRQSGGAFDVAVGSGSMILDESTCTVALSSPAVKLDLGGIAKGYALDRAAALLRENGVTAALLHGGTSSVVAIGSPPDAAAWRVALGACIFMVSDSLIAINKFVTPVELSSLWILATYYAAQVLIVHNARLTRGPE